MRIAGLVLSPCYPRAQESDRSARLVVRETSPTDPPRPRLLDRVRDTLRTHRYSRRTALLFLYRDVLGQDLPWLDDLVQAKRRPYLPVVLMRDEVRGILDRLDGVPRLMAMLMYGPASAFSNVLASA